MYTSPTLDGSVTAPGMVVRVGVGVPSSQPVTVPEAEQHERGEVEDNSRKWRRDRFGGLGGATQARSW